MTNHKRFFTGLFLFLITAAVHSQETPEPNLLYKTSIPAAGISSIKAELCIEALSLEQIYGSEINIEVYSNNEKFMPSIKLNGGLLKISSGRRMPSTITRGDYCHIKIYVPIEFKTQSFKFSSVAGSFSAQALNTEFLDANSVSGSIKFNSLSCIYAQAKSISGKIDLLNLSCQNFDVESTSGAVCIEALAAPLSRSFIKNTSGRINLHIPASSNVDFTGSTISGTVENKLTGEIFNHGDFDSVLNQGGAEINLTTVSGNIKIEE